MAEGNTGSSDTSARQDPLVGRRLASYEVLARVGAPYDRLSTATPTADHVAARLVELLPLPLSEKQALFDEPDAVERAFRLAGLVNPHGEEVTVV